MQIVFSDIDGTFQEMGHPIHEINKEAIRCLQAQGDHFVFVTGRGFEARSRYDGGRRPFLRCDFWKRRRSDGKRRSACFDAYVPYKTLAQVIGTETEEVFYFLHTDHGIISPQAHLYEAQFQESRKQLLAELGERGQIIADYKYEFFYNACPHKNDVLQFMKEHPEIKVIDNRTDGSVRRKKRTAAGDDPVRNGAIFQWFVETLEIVDPLATKGAAIVFF